MKRTRIKLDRRIESKLAEAARERLRQVAEAGAADARRRVRVETGRLRDHIDVQETEDGWRYGAFGVDYAVYQEFGTWKMVAHPFIRPSIDSAIRAAREFSRHR